MAEKISGKRSGVYLRKGNGFAAALMFAALLMLSGCSAKGWRAASVPLTISVMKEEGTGNALPAAADTSEKIEDKPRILIYHTHTWEAYEMTEQAKYTPTETWRTRDERFNVVRVGERLAECLRQLGFDVTHDRTAFEPPNLSASYTRSLHMLDARLDAGDTYDYIFDVHRDAYCGLYNGANTVTSSEGAAAYVMLLVGKGTGETGSGFDERPDWPKNLELARRITEAMNARLDGISRDVKIKSGRFNQHVSAGALLIEVGNNRNTLDEALAACPVIAQAIADVHFDGPSDQLAHM